MSYLTREEAQALTQRVLAMSRAEECRVSVGSGLEGNTRFAGNQASTVGDSVNVGVSIRSSFGNRSGSASTNVLTDEGLRRAVEASEATARLAPPDREHMPELDPQQYREIPAFFEGTVRLDAGRRAEAALAVIEGARRNNLVAAGFLAMRYGSQALANNKGLFAYHRSTGWVYTTTVRTEDGTGSGWAGASHNDWSRSNPRELAQTAIQKATASRNPVAIEPGRYTVILEPTAAASLLQLMTGFAMSARAADEGRSYFAKRGGGNKIGEQIVDARVNIWSDPADPELLTSPFTGDGLPTQRVVWIENGVLRNLNYDRYWAQRQNVAPTAAGGGLRMAGGTKSLDELIRTTERAVLVTRFWYIRGLDPRTILYTGLTRDGTFLIENGRITRAVKNLRFNESPVNMLANLEELGRPVRVSSSESGDIGGAVYVPPIKTREFNFQSVSDAV